MAYNILLSQRIDQLINESLMSKKKVKPFAITGRPMKGWLLVNSEGVKENELGKWFELAFAFVKNSHPKNDCKNKMKLLLNLSEIDNQIFSRYRRDEILKNCNLNVYP